MQLVVQEEHQVRACGERGIFSVSTPQLPQPAPQRAHPAQRPLGRGALHHEVAGEAAPAAGVVAQLLQFGIRRRLVVGVAAPWRASCARARC